MHSYIRHVFWALLAVALRWSTASYAEKRVDLVIGNGAYKSVAKLPDPPGTRKRWRRCCATSNSRWCRAPI